MAGRQFEDRITANGATFLPPGEVSRARAPWQGGETRAGGVGRPPHGAYSGEHTHEHPAHGHQGGGRHLHTHTHRGDSNHDHHSPGRPGAGMPEVELHSADLDGEISGSGIGLGEQIRRWLEAQGVNPERALQEAQTASEVRELRVRERTEQAAHIAYALRKAKRAAAYELSGWQDSAPGFSWARVVEARERVVQLDERLRDICCNDDEVRAEVLRRANR